MDSLIGQLRYYLMHRNFLLLLLIVNVFGTIYGYIWYEGQLVETPAKFLIFVPDSPTASLFFCIAIVGWLLFKHFKLMEALALVTLVKYGLWAVAMNLLVLIETGELGWLGWMLVFSHFMMAVEAVLYLPKYEFTEVHVIIAAIWTLHNDVIDYVFGHMPRYRVLNEYMDTIGYFTFWLSIACIALAWFAVKKRDYLHRM